MRKQSDEVFDFLNQFAKLHFGSALGEFIQMGVLSASGHPVLHKTAILTEAKPVGRDLDPLSDSRVVRPNMHGHEPSSPTSRMSLVRRVIKAWVRPEAVTNSTSMASDE
jgi:hypothetical protein